VDLTRKKKFAIVFSRWGFYFSPAVGLMNNIQKRGFHNLNKISFRFLAFSKIEKEVF